MAALHMIKPGGIEPDAAAGRRYRAAVRREGSLDVFAGGLWRRFRENRPAADHREEPLREGIAVLEEAIAEAIQCLTWIRLAGT